MKIEQFVTITEKDLCQYINANMKYSVSQIAELLGYGRNKLHKCLRHYGMLTDQKFPTTFALDNELAYYKSNNTQYKSLPLITYNGILYLHSRLRCDVNMISFLEGKSPYPGSNNSDDDLEIHDIGV